MWANYYWDCGLWWDHCLRCPLLLVSKGGAAVDESELFRGQLVSATPVPVSPTGSLCDALTGLSNEWHKDRIFKEFSLWQQMQCQPPGIKVQTILCCCLLSKLPRKTQHNQALGWTTLYHTEKRPRKASFKCQSSWPECLLPSFAAWKEPVPPLGGQMKQWGWTGIP